MVEKQLSDDLIQTVQYLIDTGKGDRGRLQYILNSIQKSRTLYLSDQKYLESQISKFAKREKIELRDEMKDKPKKVERPGLIKAPIIYDSKIDARHDLKYSQRSLEESRMTWESELRVSIERLRKEMDDVMARIEKLERKMEGQTRQSADLKDEFVPVTHQTLRSQDSFSSSFITFTEEQWKEMQNSNQKMIDSINALINTFAKGEKMASSSIVSDSSKDEKKSDEIAKYFEKNKDKIRRDDNFHLIMQGLIIITVVSVGLALVTLILFGALEGKPRWENYGLTYLQASMMTSGLLSVIVAEVAAWIGMGIAYFAIKKRRKN